MLTILLAVLAVAYVFLKVSNTRARFAEEDARREAEEEEARLAAEEEAEEELMREEAIDVEADVVEPDADAEE
ncbi:MAG: hypothetical protein IJ227_02120 [Mogibacterium sp.]|nr:hypothetical protein [Mogibacterium sp.]